MKSSIEDGDDGASIQSGGDDAYTSLITPNRDWQATASTVDSYDNSSST
jgi:hypothetical protein